MDEAGATLEGARERRGGAEVEGAGESAARRSGALGEGVEEGGLWGLSALGGFLL